ncbi:MAG: serine hydrolase domain-containing protein [Terracidiphilus sp.]|jgi:CubicO group peptidase (beta-lactamase class C family)
MTSQSHPSGEKPFGKASRFAAALRILEEAIAARAFPGCAFGVLAGDEVVLQGALGRFTYEEDAPAVAAETVYDVASLTKVVATTAAAMLLVQRGQLDLETPLGELLPGFVVGRAPGDFARTVTLQHLLAHNSGLPGHVEFFQTAATPAALFHACLELPLQAAPGTHAEYSDPGFILLGKALEVLIRENLASWTRREVFQPLGMAATGFCPSPAMRPAIPPTEEDLTFRHRRIQGEVQDENAWVLNGVAGHAGLFSNAPDLLRFAGAILGSAKPASSEENPSLFDSAVLKQFARRQPPEGSSCALGWDTPSQPSSSGKHFAQHSIGHLGYSGCSLWIDLDAAVAVVLLTNRTWPDRQNQRVREVRPLFHDAVREAL